MQRLLLTMAMGLCLIALALATDSSGSIAVVENVREKTTITVDDTHNTTVFQPADDFIPKDNGASKAVGATSPSDGNAKGGLSSLAVAVIISVSAAGVILGVSMIAYAWRASRREEEAMFMDLGDERNYAYGRFGDYAAM
ncbi:unnamed protein product [Phytophthora lilii]|uniref:Unnamed protein product n=1 Tax=Phytophthora lilii TaxID=2077276 RepID=A0A9W6X3Z8_9STRA|nr:unnamed protein product [Phytophthora lilii]